MNSNNNKAIIYMLIDSLSYSLIPVLAALTINKLHVIPYLGLSIILAVFTYTVYLIFNKITLFKYITKRICFFSFIAGITYVISHGLLVYSINKSENSYLPSIIFQIYPLMIVFLLLKYKLSHETINLKKIFIMSLSLIGIIIFNYDETLLNDKYNFSSIILPSISAFFLAISITFVIRANHELKDKINPEITPILTSYYSRIVSLIIVLPILLIYLYLNNMNLDLTNINILTIFIYGSICMAIGTIYYYRGIILTTNSLSIHIISYLSIIMSILWLWLFELGTMTGNIMIGSAYILVSNVILNFNIDKNSAYIGSLLSTLFVGSLLYLYNGIQMDNYWDAISIPILFFAITIAFLVDRIFKRRDDSEIYTLELINNLNYEEESKDKKFLINEVINISRVTVKNISNIYNKIKFIKLSKENSLLLNKLILLKMQRVNSSEIFVLGFTAFISVFIILIYTDEVNAYTKLIQLCLTTIIIFNLLYIFDNDKGRNEKIFNIEENENDTFITTNSEIDNEKTTVEKIISIVLLICIFLMFLIAFSLKFN